MGWVFLFRCNWDIWKSENLWSDKIKHQIRLSIPISEGTFAFDLITVDVLSQWVWSAFGLGKDVGSAALYIENWLTYIRKLWPQKKVTTLYIYTKNEMGGWCLLCICTNNLSHRDHARISIRLVYPLDRPLWNSPTGANLYLLVSVWIIPVYYVSQSLNQQTAPFHLATWLLMCQAVVPTARALPSSSPLPFFWLELPYATMFVSHLACLNRSCP